MKLITWNFWKKYWKSIAILNTSEKLNSIYQIVSNKILFENPQSLQRMHELINVLPPTNFAVFNCFFFLGHWLQRAETCTNCIKKPSLLIFELIGICLCFQKSVVYQTFIPPPPPKKKNYRWKLHPKMQLRPRPFFSSSILGHFITYKIPVVSSVARDFEGARRARNVSAPKSPQTWGNWGHAPSENF